MIAKDRAKAFFFEKKNQKTFVRLAIGLPLFLSACGDLPRPFAGRPGPQAVVLATPPFARLAVLVPRYPGFDPAHAKIWADDIAASLIDAEMPAIVGAPSNVDWSVLPAISRQGDQVVPDYELHDGTGKLRGTIDGTPWPAHQWSTGDAQILKQTAQQAAPKIGDLLTQIENARMAADPNSLLHRAAKVLVVAGQGAAGDGNQSLPSQMRVYLKTHGIVVTEDPREADFKVAPAVEITAIADPTQQQVQIIWEVTDALGREAGKIAQLNDIPAHSLDGHWGEVAEAAAQEAAGGVAEVINNRLPTAPKPGGITATPAATPPPPPPAQPAALAPRAQSLTVQFASFSSRSHAEREWRRLAADHPALFQNRAPEIVPLKHDDHVRYGLRATGFKDRTGAEAFCAQLGAEPKVKSANCVIK